MKPRKMRWTEHIALTGDMKNAYKIFIGKPEGKRPREDLGIDGIIIIEWILGKQGEKCELDSCGSGQRQVAGPCEHGNEPSSSIKGAEFLH
jgi:hypothetical protein